MTFAEIKKSKSQSLENILGYLNYSSGDFTPAFYKALDDLAEALEGAEERTAEELQPLALWRKMGMLLWEYLDEIQSESKVFAQNDQARAAIWFVCRHFIPQYREWHKVLLFHQSDDTLFNAFSIGQLFQTVLKEQTSANIPVPNDASSRDFLPEAPLLPKMPEVQIALRNTILKYDDYIGYRPIPVLHNKQQMQPYRHEWVHAVPLYIEGVGALHGPYHKIITDCLEILQNLNEQLRIQAMFDFDNLKELTFDPRAMDFEHPVNRRLNYHFGSWDLTDIGVDGLYHRFVLVEPTLKSIVSRVYSGIAEEQNIPKEELELEASAVLAGTLLMGCAVSGWGPGARISEDTFTVLLPKIAKLRDEFYQQLIEKMTGKHAVRLREEEEMLHQPFASTRQYFNRNLAERRAVQYQKVQLARLYAWMGYLKAAGELIEEVPVPAARMKCEIDELITQAHLSLDHERASEAIPMLYRIEEILHEGIECGALLDPWYILGYDGQYPLSSSIEDSTNDQRVDEMIMLVNSIFGLYSRILKDAAARGFNREVQELRFRLQEFADWWDQFGALNLDEIKGISGAETVESIQLVTDALHEWHEGGTARGDLAFWHPRVIHFKSAKAYTLLIEALLDQKDSIASMTLLIYWLSQLETIPLEDGDYSFHPIALRWMEDLWYPPTPEQRLLAKRGDKLHDSWELAKRFIELIEANSMNYASPEEMTLNLDSAAATVVPVDNDDDDDEDADKDLFRSAWEDIMYRDSANDGNDSEMMDPDEMKNAMDKFPLTDELERLSDRLIFLITRARLWKMAAVFSIPFAKEHPDRRETMEDWSKQINGICEGLMHLLEEVQRFEVEMPDITRPIAMMEYEKQVGIKFSLLDRIVSTFCELRDAQRLMRIADVENPIQKIKTWEDATQCVIQSLILSDRAQIHRIWSQTMNLLSREQILYVPIDRGGDAKKMIHVRSVLTVLRRLLCNLPQQGMVVHAYRVLAVVQQMEREHTVGMRAITRYDSLFDLGSKAILKELLKSASKNPKKPWKVSTIIPVLDGMIQILMQNWINHSRGIRISSLDVFSDPQEWKGLKAFIQKYGDDLLSPIDLSYSNLQAIHHQGVRNWVSALMEFDDPKGKQIQLVNDLRERKYSLTKAEFYLDAIVETLLERYGQFIDYNSTTTQSDKGSNLYMLFDFLRLLGEYDRTAWDIRPFMNGHEVMVREKSYEVADTWCECMQERSQFASKRYIRRYKKLCLKYGIVVKTVLDRLNERFVRPMSVNKLCALLEPAIQEARQGGETPSFDQFLVLVKEFMAEPSGTGYDLPSWLEAVDDEIQRYRDRSEKDDEMINLSDFIPQLFMTLREAKAANYELESDVIPVTRRNSKPTTSVNLLNELCKQLNLDENQLKDMSSDEIRTMFSRAFDSLPDLPDDDSDDFPGESLKDSQADENADDDNFRRLFG